MLEQRRISYNNLRLGIPQPSPIKKFLKYLTSFSYYQVNNIGTHTLHKNIPLNSCKALENEVIKWLGKLYHNNNLDGYLCSGASEGNIMALWIAREKLKSLDKGYDFT